MPSVGLHWSKTCALEKRNGASGSLETETIFPRGAQGGRAISLLLWGQNGLCIEILTLPGLKLAFYRELRPAPVWGSSSPGVNHTPAAEQVYKSCLSMDCLYVVLWDTYRRVYPLGLKSAFWGRGRCLAANSGGLESLLSGTLTFSAPPSAHAPCGAWPVRRRAACFLCQPCLQDSLRGCGCRPCWRGRHRRVPGDGGQQCLSGRMDSRGLSAGVTQMGLGFGLSPGMSAWHGQRFPALLTALLTGSVGDGAEWGAETVTVLSLGDHDPLPSGLHPLPAFSGYSPAHGLLQAQHLPRGRAFRPRGPCHLR